MASSVGKDRVAQLWTAGIRNPVLTRTRIEGSTEAAEVAAELLVSHGWKAQTWANRSSQIKEWLVFCDEDGRDSLPAKEGELLAYLGYMYLEGRIGPSSVRNYIRDVSRFHETQGLLSPTRSPLVAAMVTAYMNKTDRDRSVPQKRIGINTEIAMHMAEFGLSTEIVSEVDSCAMVIFAFIFQCRSISVAHVSAEDIDITDAIVNALTHRKAKSYQRPLRLSYLRNPEWDAPGLLMLKWKTHLSATTGFFNLQDGTRLETANLNDAISLSLLRVGAVPPKGFFYSSHSARIGAYNELLGLGFTDAWIMNRLDCVSIEMLHVYFYSSISVTAASFLFFAYMLPRGQAA